VLLHAPLYFLLLLTDGRCGNRTGIIETGKRGHSPLLAVGLASELEIDFHHYGAAQHCRYRQNITLGLPRGGFNPTGLGIQA
jgi:hypothetical protein